MPRRVTVTFSDGSSKVYQGVPDGITAGQFMARAQRDAGGLKIAQVDGGRQPAVQTRQQGVQAAARAAVSAPRTTSVGGAIFRGLEDAIPGMNYLKAASNEVGSHLGLNDTPNSMSYLDRVRALKADQDANEDADRAQHPIAHYGAEAAGLIGSTMAGGGLIRAGAARLAAGTGRAAQVGNVLQRLTTVSKARTLGATAANAGKAAVSGAAAGAAYGAGNANPEDALASGAEGAAGGAVGGAGAVGVGRLAGMIARPAKDFLGMTDAGQYLRRFTKATTDEIAQRAADFRHATGAEPTMFELLPLADRNNLIEKGIAGRDNIVERASQGIRDRVANIGPEMTDTVNQATQQQRIMTQRQLHRDLAAANGGVAQNGDAALAVRASQSPTDMQALRREEARRIMAPHDDAQVVDNLSDLYPQHFEPHTEADRIVPTGLLDTDGNPTMRTIPGATTHIAVPDDPEINRAIQSVSGSLRARPADAPQGINVREITNMISDLADDARQGGIDGRNAGRAAEHLMGMLDTNVPEASDATARMREQFAGKSRMLEGMDEGFKSRLRDEIQVGTNQRQGNLVRNAYDTDDGAAGLQVGQGNRLLSDLGDASTALPATMKIAKGGGVRELTQNVGQNAADQISEAAGAQADSADALKSALRSAQSSNGAEPADPINLTHALLALDPGTFAVTKAGAIKKLAGLSFMPENRARTLVDMLFSQDGRMTDRAIAALNASEPGRQFIGSMPALLGAGSGSAVQMDSAPQPAPPPAAPEPQNSAVPDAAPTEPAAAAAVPAPQAGTPYDPNGTPGDPESGDPESGDQPTVAQGTPVDASQSPYMSRVSDIYKTAPTDFLNLVEGIQHRETRGRQFDKDGNPIISKAGAVGLMQLEPATARASAERAGVPYDENALHYDPAYNKLVGIQTVKDLSAKYRGDPRLVMAGYNAGPGAVDHALARAHIEGGDWTDYLPAETQNYIGA